MEELTRLLAEIRAAHPEVRSVLLVEGPHGAALDFSDREVPLWPREDREDFGSTLSDSDRFVADVEKPYCVARVDGTIEFFEDVPAASDDPRHLVLVLKAFEYDENEARIAAIDPRGLDRVTLLHEGYMESWIDFPEELDVPAIALGFCKDGLQIGWQLLCERGRNSVSLVAFDEEATLDTLEDMLRCDGPVVLEASACFRPTAADAKAVSREYLAVVLTDEERDAIVRAREVEEAAIEAERVAEEAEAARREAERYSAADCTVLVVYVIASRNAAVEPGLPRIVLREVDDFLEHFGRYESPYPLELSSSQLAARLDDLPRSCAVVADVIRDFTASHEVAWFICVLEPPAIAGDGTAIDVMS